jgi:O-acetyl-ADP-ribose deacetylase (regulator of RNase III)
MSIVRIVQGNLLTEPVQALVNTVNTEGVMGKGIALQFKLAFPPMFKAYEAACNRGEVRLGQMHVYDLGGLVGGPRWIINFPTKGHWRSKSRLNDIKEGLNDLIRIVKELGVESIAVPPLGCGYGGLNWNDVRPLIEAAFANVEGIDVRVFPPDGAPAPDSMPNRTERPKMTPGQAALLAITKRYQQGLLDPFVSLLEIHKLMYFLQEAGQPLRLKYEAMKFGPYATNLRQVLIRIEGHYIVGYGDGQDNPTKPIELKDEAIHEAMAVLEQDPELIARIERVSSLIDGYEDPYGLELLSSMHWVMCNDEAARTSVEAGIQAVHDWNLRKKEVLKADHLRKAWERLKKLNWDVECRSATH